MLQFISEDFKELLLKSIEWLTSKNFGGSIAEIDFDSIIDTDQWEDFEDIVISDDSEASLLLDRADESYDNLTTKQLINMCQRVKNAKIDESKACAYCDDEVCFYIEGHDYDTMVLIDRLFNDGDNINVDHDGRTWMTKVRINDFEYSVFLYKGVTLFNLLSMEWG